MDAATDALENNVPFSKNRILDDPQQIFLHNAWDDACWTAEQIKNALNVVKDNSEKCLSSEAIDKYENFADVYWDEFYSTHQDNFFKDRKWLFHEFPELITKDSGENVDPELSSTNSHTFPLYSYYFVSNKVFDRKMPKDYLISSFNIFEVGCGVGNTIFPILNANKHHQTFVFGCDFSKKAISVLKANSSYDAARCHVFVHDVTSDGPLPLPVASMDVIIMVFVLSAIDPSKFERTVSRLATYLKPGGTVLFRDYGRYDMAQLRFKKGELRDLFGTKCGLIEVQNSMDKRILVNRKKLLQMHRVWIQCKYSKSLHHAPPTAPDYNSVALDSDHNF